MTSKGGFSLATQIIATACFAVALVSIATVFVWVRQLRDVLEGETRDEAVAISATLASVEYATLAERNYAQLQLDFEAMAERTPDLAYVVVTEDKRGGAVVASMPRELSGSNAPDVVPPSVTRGAVDGARGQRITTTSLLRGGVTGTAGDPVVDVVDDVRARDGTLIGTLRVGVRFEHGNATLARAARAALTIGGVVLVIGMLFAALLARRMAAPVASLRDRMTRVGEGKLEEHAEASGPTEVRALAAAYNEMIGGLRQKRALERYVPLGARRAIAELGDAAGIIAARRERVVVLFADLRGFSTLSEKTAPAAMLAMLSDFADAMAEVVTESGGDVNELLGDAVLAVFVPNDAMPAAEAAVRCAVRMQERLGDIGGGDLRMGVGLHVGEIVMGTVGTGERLKFALVGDTVNVAARIQERSKEPLATGVLASDELKTEAGPKADWLDRGEMAVRGRTAGIHLWELRKIGD